MSTDTTARLQRIVDLLLENGWQPADLVHVTKRGFNQRTSRLVVACLAIHARRFDAPTRAPEEWLAQLHDLGVYHQARGTIVGGAGDPIAAWARQEKLHPDEVQPMALQVVVFLHGLPKMPSLLAPPARWPASNKGVAPSPAAHVGEIDGKALKVIRALLAKAEATTFEAEATSFTAKAQELMTKHSIDAAVLAASEAGLGHGAGLRRGVVSRRVHIDDPYAEEKATFLSAIADVNGVKSVWMPQSGLCTVMGFPVDVQLTDLLFTSLLVQATHMSAEATAHDRRLRTPSFKRAFLIAFADRVAERLEVTRRHVAHEAEAQYGSALVPILADREAAVEAAYRDAFPGATVMPTRRLNAAGWHAGRAAGDRADIGAGAAITRG
jgi:hypothetical protein